MKILKIRKTPTRSQIDISKEFKNRLFNKNNEELNNIFKLNKWTSLKRESELYDSLLYNQEKIPRFKRSREKIYLRLSKELWEKLKNNNGYQNLNDIIERNKFHRAKSIRIIRKWDELGILDILDKSKMNQNLITYLIKLNLKTKSLPNIFYMYSRTEYLTKKTTKYRRRK